MSKPILVQHPKSDKFVDVAPFLDLILGIGEFLIDIDDLKRSHDEANRLVNLYCKIDIDNPETVSHLHSFHHFMYLMKDLFNDTSVLTKKGGSDEK